MALDAQALNAIDEAGRREQFDRLTSGVRRKVLDASGNEFLAGKAAEGIALLFLSRVLRERDTEGEFVEDLQASADRVLAGLRSLTNALPTRRERRAVGRAVKKYIKRAQKED